MPWTMVVGVMASRVEDRRSDCSLPVAVGLGFASPASIRFGLALFPVRHADLSTQLKRGLSALSVTFVLLLRIARNMRIYAGV
jgi:hypothetical protein